MMATDRIRCGVFMRAALSVWSLSACIFSVFTCPAQAANYKLLYSFQGNADGRWPTAGLINVDGTLYGTTEQGGVTNCTDIGGHSIGCGTLYSITPAGQETVLYRFQASKDGADPRGPLIYSSGMFYGTTLFGAGDTGCGTLFSLMPNGQEQQIYTFPASQSKGCNPGGPLLQVKSSFYGTSLNGGKVGAGSAFEVSADGKARVLVDFANKGRNQHNGQSPSGGFVQFGDKLYSTTIGGGVHQECDGLGINNGCGIVFSTTLDGHERILYRFLSNNADGAMPWAGLVDIGGTFYGTTYTGGAHDDGAIFSITPDGKEKVIYSFLGAGAGDGAIPVAGLIAVGNVLYGTTEYGGNKGCGGIPVPGCGTVFSVTPDGKETVLYSFQGSGDGGDPAGTLLNVNGTLYGTAIAGGATGAGTVFTVTP